MLKSRYHRVTRSRKNTMKLLTLQFNRYMKGREKRIRKEEAGAGAGAGAKILIRKSVNPKIETKKAEEDK
jgi:hypothetical protein